MEVEALLDDDVIDLIWFDLRVAGRIEIEIGLDRSLRRYLVSY